MRYSLALAGQQLQSTGHPRISVAAEDGMGILVDGEFADISVLIQFDSFNFKGCRVLEADLKPKKMLLVS